MFTMPVKNFYNFYSIKMAKFIIQKINISFDLCLYQIWLTIKSFELFFKFFDHDARCTKKLTNNP